MSELIYNNCFACGKDNPIGLKLEFEYTENSSVAYHVVGDNFQGYHDIVHGGIVTTLLDEAMAKIIHAKGMVAVTGDINVKFRRAVPTNKEIKITGTILKERSRTIQTTGKIEFDGKILAEATATFVKVKK